MQLQIKSAAQIDMLKFSQIRLRFGSSNFGLFWVVCAYLYEKVKDARVDCLAECVPRLLGLLHVVGHSQHLPATRDSNLLYTVNS